ncbi:putative PI3/PI4-kinase family protein C1F5.11c [Bienertia sinuspersici]
MSSHNQSTSSVRPMQSQPKNTTIPSITGRLGQKIKVPHHYPSSSTNPNHGVIDSWLKLGPIVVKKLSRWLFVLHCILKDDKRNLLHHALAFYHANLVILKDWREELALRDYRFVEFALWVRVDDIPANVNHTNVALKILNKLGVCIFIDKYNTPEKPQRATRVRLWLDLRKPLIPGPGGLSRLG